MTVLVAVGSVGSRTGTRGAPRETPTFADDSIMEPGQPSGQSEPRPRRSEVAVDIGQVTLGPAPGDAVGQARGGKWVTGLEHLAQEVVHRLGRRAAQLEVKAPVVENLFDRRGGGAEDADVVRGRAGAEGFGLMMGCMGGGAVLSGLSIGRLRTALGQAWIIPFGISYWSSSQCSATEGRILTVATGHSCGTKDQSKAIRPVRDFD